MIKYGIIGTGWIAEEFVKGTLYNKRMEPSAVYSRREGTGRAFAGKFGIDKVFCDLNAFAAADFDAVYIASPNSLHYEQSKLMLKNSKHVICEKPAAVSERELSELYALADEKKLIFIEAIMYLHLPQRKILKNALKDIGRLTGAKFDFSQLSSKYPAYLRGENPNIFNPRFQTGALMDLGIYCLYPAVDLLGEPEDVTAVSSFLESGADESTIAVLKYDNINILTSCCKTGQGAAGSEITGECGTVKIPSISRLTQMSLIKNGIEAPLTGGEEKHVAMAYESYDFADYIEGKRLDEYKENNETTKKVISLMEKIRALSGIEFPGID